MIVRYLALLVVAIALLPHLAEAQWQKAPDFPNDFFNEVYFLDSQTGWVTRMNGTVSRTVDGGNTWQSSTLPGASWSSNRDIRIVSSTGGFVSGEDGIWKTTDGGASWANITPTGFPAGSVAMWFTDMSTGVAGVGNCIDSTATFFRTTDGGATWASVTHTSTPDVAVGGITYMGGTWYVAGGRGKLWTSNDGGATWTLLNTGSNGWQEDVIAWGSDLLIASTNGSSCGASNGGMVLRSTNGGTTWTSTPFGTLMWGVTRYSATDGWACGDGGLALKTTDGGATWTNQSCGLPAAIRVDDIHFTGPNSGWAVGDGLYRLADQTIEASPDTIDFGDIKVGTRSRDSNAIVRSYFTSATTASLRIGGTDPAQFAVSGGLLSIPVGICNSSPAPVHFAPTSRGPKTALLEVAVVPPSTARRFVVLKGRGIEPEIAVSAKSRLDTIVCGTSVLDSILIRNLGEAPLTVTQIRWRDPAGGELRPAGPAIPFMVPPGGEQWLKVRATATVPGPYESELDIFSDDTGPGRSPVLVKMRYYRRTIAASYTTTALTLPATRVGDRSAGGCVEYRNSGDGDQVIESVAPLEGSAAIVPVGIALPVTVPAGATVRLCFEGSPSDTGWFERRFRVRTQPCALDTAVTVRLYGRAAYVRSDTLRELGAITCERAARATTTIHNDGNDTLVLERPTIGGPDAAGVTIVGPLDWPLRIAPRSTAELVVDLEPVSPAPSATLTMATNDPRPGRALWSIRVTTSRTTAAARPSERRLDAGSLCLGDERTLTLTIEGIGTAAAHVTGARVIDGDDVTITLPPSGVDLVAGVLDSLRVRVAPTQPGPFRRLLELRSEPCGRVDTIEVVGSGASVALSSSSDVITLGTIIRGRPTSVRAVVRNEGTVPATITAAPAGAPSRLTVTSPALPVTIAPGDSIELTLGVATDDAGVVDELLMVIAESVCRDTLALRIEGSIVAPGGSSLLVHTTELSFLDRLRCEDSCASVVIEAIGTGPIEIRGARIEGSTTMRLGAFAPTSIAPGDSLAIDVCYTPARDDESASATLVLTTSDTTLREIRIPLLGSATGGLSTEAMLSFGVVADNAVRDTSLTVVNRSSRTLTITTARTSAPFEVLSPMPIVIAPGAIADILLRARDVATFTEARLVLETSHPCGDSLVVMLDALSDDRFVVTARADTTIARWGTRADIAIAYVDTTGAGLGAVDLVVTAAPTLLHPVSERLAAGRVIERRQYDAATGTLSLRIVTTGGVPIGSTDSLVVVTYDVLRGDRIATPVEPLLGSLRRGVASTSEPGAFLLADYCDAHGRLLSTRGSIALERSIPNPASTACTIELETAFDGPLTLTLHDARGVEVLRLVDEWSPAGRRRVDVPLGGLPAGTYTYRMTTGRQVLTQPMVVIP